MPRRREVPFDTTGYHPRGVEVAVSAAQSDMAALMEALPFMEPQLSREALLPLREVLEDAIDGLSGLERWVFNACIVERKALRAVGAELSLSKSHVHRIKDRACARLAGTLGDHPLILAYLNRSPKRCERKMEAA